MKSTYKLITAAMVSAAALAHQSAYAGENVADAAIAEQRSTLAEGTEGAGFGPQSPRDIDILTGENTRAFSEAPDYTQMNLCNIHFHEGAEHKGGEYGAYIGNGDGEGHGTGFEYSGELTAAESAPLDKAIGDKGHGGLQPGDTIEAHYVYTTAQVEPGPTLGACLSEAIGNPQLRVEAQVYVLVNDDNALDFVELAKHGLVNGFHQAMNIPVNTGAPVEYEGSTTGPGYNEKGSPYQVSWGVRPKVAKVNIKTVEKWFENNDFDEDHAHGVRNLVVNPKLLSPIN